MNGYEWRLKYNPDQPRVPAGGAGGGRWISTGRNIASVEATQQSRKDLTVEWVKMHDDPGGEPFWDAEGEDEAQYWTSRDEDGKLLAGATTVRHGNVRHILSIASHAPKAGQEILDELKSRYTWLSALAGGESGRSFFQRNGFIYRPKPGQYDWLWMRKPKRGG